MRVQPRDAAVPPVYLRTAAARRRLISGRICRRLNDDSPFRSTESIRGENTMRLLRAIGSGFLTRLWLLANANFDRLVASLTAMILSSFCLKALDLRLSDEGTDGEC